MQLVGVTLTAAVSGALGVAPRPPSATSTSGSCLKRSGQRRKRTKAKNGRVQSNMKTKKVSQNKLFSEKKGKKYFHFYRCEQGSNLCGKMPLDFKSNALTTRPQLLYGFTRVKNDWRCRGSNPGPFTCKANALPLSYIPI